MNFSRDSRANKSLLWANKLSLCHTQFHGIICAQNSSLLVASEKQFKSSNKLILDNLSN